MNIKQLEKLTRFVSTALILSTLLVIFSSSMTSFLAEIDNSWKLLTVSLLGGLRVGLEFSRALIDSVSQTLAQAETDQSSMMAEINRLRKHVHEVADHEEYLKRKNTELEEYGAYLEKRKNRLDALEIEKSDATMPKQLKVQL